MFAHIHSTIWRPSAAALKENQVNSSQEILKKVVVNQEEEVEDSYPDIPSPGYVPLRRAAEEEEEDNADQTLNWPF